MRLRISNYIVLLMCLAGVLFALVDTAAPQNIPNDDLFLPHRWDAGHGVVFFGKGLLRKDNRPIHSYADGIPRGPGIDLFKDFPHARTIIVDDFAASSDGSSLIAAVLNFGGSNLRHVILRYDSAGKLLSELDTEPYYAQAIATDEMGDIFTLGNKLKESKNDVQPYPLMIVYDSEGHVVHQGLLSSEFKKGSRAVNQSEDAVDPSLMVRDGKVFIYAPLESEVLICSKDSTILRRMPLDGILAKIRKTEGFARVTLKNVAFVDENRVVLEIVGHTAPGKPLVQNSAEMHPAAYILNLNTGRFSLALRGQMPDWNFLGVKDHQLLMLSVGAQHSTIAHEITEE
jgi:hypothetical protein